MKKLFSFLLLSSCVSNAEPININKDGETPTHEMSVVNGDNVGFMAMRNDIMSVQVRFYKRPGADIEIWEQICKAITQLDASTPVGQAKGILNAVALIPDSQQNYIFGGYMVVLAREAEQSSLALDTDGFVVVSSSEKELSLAFSLRRSAYGEWAIWRKYVSRLPHIDFSKHDLPTIIQEFVLPPSDTPK